MSALHPAEAPPPLPQRPPMPTLPSSSMAVAAFLSGAAVFGQHLPSDINQIVRGIGANLKRGTRYAGPSSASRQVPSTNNSD